MLFDPLLKSLGSTTRVPTVTGAQELVDNITGMESRKPDLSQQIALVFSLKLSHQSLVLLGRF